MLFHCWVIVDADAIDEQGKVAISHRPGHSVLVAPDVPPSHTPV